MAEAVIEQTKCPDCGAPVPFNQGFVTWCAACDWNVDPIPPPKLNRRDRYFANASARASRRLYERISAKGIDGPPPRSLVITLIAATVHLLTVITTAGGLLFLVGGLGLPVSIRIFFGGLLLAIAFIVQPFRHRSKKKKSKPAKREQLPQLYALVDDVAKELGCKGLDGIRFDVAYNAWISHTRSDGWVMTIGLPMWATLSPQERVALIGHELGHQLNHDQRNGMLVHGAAISMRQWSYLLTPSKLMRYGGGSLGTGVAALGAVIANLLLLPLAAAAGALSRLLTIFAGRQGLSAEYYADALSARVAGTDAAASSLENHLLAGICVNQLRHIAKFDTDADPWIAIAEYAASIPAHEIERQRRLGRLHLPAIDSTHPPTQLRADLVGALPYQTAKVVLDSGRSEAIERELAGPRNSGAKLLRSYYPR